MEPILLKIRDVVALTGLSRATIYRLVKAKTFPLPINTGIKVARWRFADVKKWQEPL